jgi:hypothetical protein
VGIPVGTDSRRLKSSGVNSDRRWSVAGSGLAGLLQRRCDTGSGGELVAGDEAAHTVSNGEEVSGQNGSHSRADCG